MSSSWSNFSKGSRLFQFILGGLLCSEAAIGQTKQPVDTVVRMTAKGAAKAPQDRDVKQIVYKMNPRVSVPVSLAMTAGNFLALPHILHAKKDISQAELAALRPELLSSLDRWAVEQDPTGRDKWFKISDVTLPATIAASLSIFLDKKIRKDGWKIALMFYEAQATTFTIYNFSPIGPAFQNRLRPLVYYDNVFDPALRLRGGQRNSMFSGHAAHAAAATFFAVKVYLDYHPELGNKKYMWYAIALVPPMFAGYTRIKALAHFPSDVAIGLLVGAVSGIGIPSLHKIRPRQVQFGITYNDFGNPGLGVKWKPARKNFKLRKNFGESPALAFGS